MSEEDKLEQFRDDFGTLIELGFVATKQSDEKVAKDLFFAARALDQESAAPIVGLAYIHLNKLELEDAEEGFKMALEMDPDHHLAQAFLGITYLLNDERRKEGEQMLSEAMSKTDDPAIRDLVDVSLKWADKDLKKRKAPFFGDTDD